MAAASRLVLFLGLVAALRAADPELVVAGPEHALSLTAEEIAALPHRTLAIADPHSGKIRNFSGVDVRELLTRVDAPLGARLRGNALGLAVLVRASDGYQVVFSLADFDEAFGDRGILLAEQEDGKPLAANAAPLQLVVPGDKRPARWIRLVTEIDLVRPSPPARVPPAKP